MLNKLIKAYMEKIKLIAYTINSIHKENDKMFLLKKIVVENHQNTVLDVTFIDNQQKENEQPFSTLILGENGTGKSFLLKTIADIFIFLDKMPTSKRKP